MATQTHEEAWTQIRSDSGAVTGWRQVMRGFDWSSDELTTLYQFGVYKGHSIVTAFDALKEVGKNIDTVYGFDSFEGLPERTNEERQAAIEKHGFYEWESGQFSSNEFYGVDDSKGFLQTVFDKYLDTEVKLIKGWFEDTLNHDAVKKHDLDLKPAAYIDVDVDTYTSSVEVLDFVFSEGIAVAGTVIGFDDWGGTPDWKGMGDGVSRACKETIEKYKLDLKVLSQTGTDFPHVHIMCRVN
jgi:hypothetical protein